MGVERPAFTSSRGTSLAYLTGVYVIAVAVAWGTFNAVGLSPMLAMIVGLLTSMLVCFAATLHVNNGSVFDAYWSVLPPVAAFYFVSIAPLDVDGTRQLAVLVVVIAWAVRLTANWARSFPGLHHEDFRYVSLYESTPLPRWMTQLVLVDFFPAMQVALGCLALYPALSIPGAGFSNLDTLALFVGLAATLIELVADEQMRAFVRTAPPGAHMDRGLWRYSRHPNYFGELLFWFSLWLFAVAAAPEFWWTIIGALAMLLMFVFASIPMMDNRSVERRPGFLEYQKRTSSLIPWPPREQQ